MNASDKIRVAQLIVFTVVAAFGISVVVFGHWWSPPHVLDTDALEKQIASAMQHDLDTRDDTKSLVLRVTSENMSIINVNGTGNEYEGMIHVSTSKGTDVQVGMTVYADNTGQWIYQLDPGSVLKLTTAAEKDREG